MTDRSSYLDLIRELVKGDPEAYRQRCEQLDEEGWDELGLVVGAAFFLAVRQHFGPATTTSAVITLVAETRAAMAGTGFDLNPTVAEQLLTSATTGDIEALEAVEPNLIIESEMLLLWQLLRARTDSELAGFLAEVEVLAEQWSREE
ncbi:hypothetical protein [Micromonospora sp. NBC_01796]|uniref:hypothetical protein n=1 Tax=Micromonospora sp. NBC_01796 TaxID=2975987 RepID=UPI002DDAEAE7|nr:hypothetical protein [Micromonospora sp. NBC_01796]WSA87857.1 hypothetical protein OIE47_09770 [Micromonospora sp. NBC_01796]